MTVHPNCAAPARGRRDPEGRSQETRAHRRLDPEAPIGAFDSGVGGLSVLREIRRELPGEDLIYVADSGYAPYGDRPEGYVRARAVAIVEFLLTQGVKAVVVACNTATGAAVDALRDRFDLPIVAIEPAVKPAVARTRTGVVGVMATTQTLAGEKFARLVRSHAGDVEVLTQACPGLVEHVESGAPMSSSARSLVEQYLRPLIDSGADTIVLGCTHYPFLEDLIRASAGPDVTIIDSALPVARELRRRLEASGLLAPPTRRGAEAFWTTGPPERVHDVMTRLWGREVDVRAVPVTAPNE